MTQLAARSTRNRSDVSSSPIVSLSKKLYTHCLVLVDFSNGFECYLQSQNSSQKACLTMELKIYSINSETTDDGIVGFCDSQCQCWQTQLFRKGPINMWKQFDNTKMCLVP